MCGYCRSRIGRRMAVLTGALIALCTFGRADDYLVHVVDPPITDHMVLPDAPLPPVCKEDRNIRLSACRGEYESASFVVTASGPLESVRIEVGPVSGPGGSWPNEAVDVRVVKDYYRSIPAHGAAVVPTLLVHDDRFLAIEPAPTEKDTKAMKNVAGDKLRDAAELQPVTIKRRKQFWITVHVPENANPGTHRATLRIAPQNAEPCELALQIEVYPFVLLPPMLEYSMYYPTYLLLPGQKRERFNQVTDEQYVLELRNMLAHGLTNPNIYQGPHVRADGSLDFSLLERILELRESIGMRPDVLYLVGSPVLFQDRPLTQKERRRTHGVVKQVKTWAKKRGYYEVFHMANDEWWGERLSRERDSMIAVNEAGGAVFSAVMQTTFYDRVGDVLTRPVLKAPTGEHISQAAAQYDARKILTQMTEIGKAGSFSRMQADDGFRKAIDGIHRQGRKVFTYMNPTAGTPLPGLQRRNEGLGLWRVGFDGTMTWAYVHIQGHEVDQPIHFAKVYRAADGVIDTLHWEGFREGVDDVRYLTTLLTKLNEAAGRFPNAPLVAETHQWFRKLDVAGGDLDAMRQEMARRIVAFMDLGHKEVPPEEALAGIDLDCVKIVTFPEPWQFKIDPDDLGIREKWFDPAVDDGGWAKLRTDKQIGWEKQGFAKQAVGFGWYRARLPLTKDDLAGKLKWLYFEAIDEDARLYLNGRKIFEHTFETTGLLPSQIWLVPFSVSLEGAELRGGDLLAVRVKSTGGMGGIWKPVHLILSPHSLTEKQLHALLELHRRKGRPSQSE